MHICGLDVLFLASSFLSFPLKFNSNFVIFPPFLPENPILKSKGLEINFNENYSG